VSEDGGEPFLNDRGRGAVFEKRECQSKIRFDISPKTVGGFNSFTGFGLMFQTAVLVKE
jgi:hypothetical protein